MQKRNAKDVPEFGLVKGNPMYGLVEELEKIAFLKRPELLKGMNLH